MTMLLSKPSDTLEFEFELEPGRDVPTPNIAISNANDLEALFRMLPHQVVAAVGGRTHDLEEIKMRQNRLLMVNWGGEYQQLEYLVSKDDVKTVVDYIGGFRADGRAGIDGTVHRICEVRDRYSSTTGVTVRVGRFLEGVAEPLRDLLEVKRTSILILGAPGVGKSTLLRDVVRIIAQRIKAKLLLVDTSGEIGGSGSSPHPGIGMADVLPVPSPDVQADIIEQAVKNHGAEILVVDEIGYNGDAMVLQAKARGGIGVIATAHGITISDAAFNPALHPVLGDPDEHWKRRMPSTFKVIIEVPAKGIYKVYNDANAALDLARAGETPIPEERVLEAK
jgi:stage III sporulation protein SpoIIIAA